MNYVEILRMRRNLTWLAGVLGALCLIAMISVNLNAGGMHLRMGMTHSHFDGGLDLAALFGIGVAITLIFATIIGGTLSRENETPEMIRTKPFAREQMALSFFLTDLAAILLSFVITCALVSLVLLDVCAIAGVFPPLRFGPEAGVILTLGLGVAFMWYALVQAVSAGLRARGGIVIGLSWAYFTILVGLAHATFLPGFVHEVIMLLNLLNPLAYMNSLTSHGDSLTTTVPNSIFALDAWLRAAIVWAIGIAACLVATFNWKRLEF
jgi:hypothetical protein